MAERQVVFYACQDVAKKSAFDRLVAASGINALEDEDWRIPDGLSQLAVIVDQAGSETKPTHLRLLRIRADRPVKLSAARKLSPVEVAANEDIAEFTWAVLWKDNYLAAVSSRDAPSHKRLATYFRATSEQETHIVNLFQPDIVEKLHELRQHGLRKVLVKIHRSEARQIELDQRVKGFKNILKAGRATGAATIGIELGVGRSGPAAVLNAVLGKSTENLASHYIDAVESMYVRGYDESGAVRELNMKAERIRGAIEIGSTTSDDDVYKGIKAVRKAVEEEIKSLNRAARGN
jgi:hypothetical protein